MKYERYQKFRQQTYQMLGKAKDATFELMDSVMTTRNASCLAEFSLSPLFRRKWSSRGASRSAPTYEALQDSRPNRNKLMKRYIKEIRRAEYVLLGIDHTAWGRRGAKTLKDRTYEPTLAIPQQIINPWKGCTVNIFTFNGDWFALPSTQNPRKISWLETR
jgi:hypothetical protein